MGVQFKHIHFEDVPLHGDNTFSPGETGKFYSNCFTKVRTETMNPMTHSNVLHTQINKWPQAYMIWEIDFNNAAVLTCTVICNFFSFNPLVTITIFPMAHHAAKLWCTHVFLNIYIVSASHSAMLKMQNYYILAKISRIQDITMELDIRHKISVSVQAWWETQTDIAEGKWLTTA